MIRSEILQVIKRFSKVFFPLIGLQKLHNWSLVSQGHDLASHAIDVVRINFIHEWLDLHF